MPAHGITPLARGNAQRGRAWRSATDPRGGPGTGRSARTLAHHGLRSGVAGVLPVPAAVDHGLPARPGPARRRRGAHPHPGRRSGHEHRDDGRREPGLETGPGRRRARRRLPPGHLPNRTSPGRGEHSRVHEQALSVVHDAAPGQARGTRRPRPGRHCPAGGPTPCRPPAVAGLGQLPGKPARPGGQRPARTQAGTPVPGRRGSHREWRHPAVPRAARGPARAAAIGCPGPGRARLRRAGPRPPAGRRR
jgi:hypothetical protein